MGRIFEIGGHRVRSASRRGVGNALEVPRRMVANFTLYDPSNVSSGETDAGNAIRFALQNPTQISGLPNTGASLSIPIEDLLGQAADSDILDLLAGVAVFGADDPPSADLRIGAVLANGPLQTATVGFGVCLTASGTDWLVGHLVSTAGTWSVTNAAASSASTRGGLGQALFMTSTTQRRVQASPLDATGAGVAGTNLASAIATAAVGDNLTHFGLFAGWVTGGGTGTPGNVDVQGYEMVLRQTQISRAGRL